MPVASAPTSPSKASGAGATPPEWKESAPLFPPKGESSSTAEGKVKEEQSSTKVGEEKVGTPRLEEGNGKQGAGDPPPGSKGKKDPPPPEEPMAWWMRCIVMLLALYLGY